VIDKFTGGYGTVGFSWNLNPDYDKPDVLMMDLKADMPDTTIAKAATMAFWVEISKKNQIGVTNKINQLIVCQSDGADANNAASWTTTGSLYDWFSKAKTWVAGDETKANLGATPPTWEAFMAAGTKDAAGWTFDDPRLSKNAPDTTWVPRTVSEDFSDFSDPSAPKTSYVSRCRVKLDVSKDNTDFFTTYTVKYGVWSKTTGRPIPYNKDGLGVSVGQDITFVQPVSTEKVEASDYEPTFLKDHINFIEIEQLKALSTKHSVTLPSEQVWASQSVTFELWATPAFSADDVLRINWYLDVPKVFLPEGAFAYQYVQLFKSGSTEKVTVGCRTTVGKANSQVVEQFAGGKDFNEA